MVPFTFREVFSLFYLGGFVVSSRGFFHFLHLSERSCLMTLIRDRLGRSVSRQTFMRDDSDP